MGTKQALPHLSKNQPGWVPCETEKGSELHALGLPIVFVAVQAHRHGECADEHLASKTAHSLIRFPTYAGNNGIIATPCCGMVQCISASEEDLGQIFMVICHHSGARCFLCHSEVVDIFGSVESLFLEFEVMLVDLWVGEVDGMRLVSIFCNIGEVKTESLAQLTKLDLAMMLERDVERLLCNLLMGQHWTVVWGD